MLVVEHFLELSAPSGTGAENVPREPVPDHQMVGDTPQPDGSGALKSTFPGLNTDGFLQDLDMAFPGDRKLKTKRKNRTIYLQDQTAVLPQGHQTTGQLHLMSTRHLEKREN